MLPLIHVLIKQPALCLSHGLYLSPRTTPWAGGAHGQARCCVPTHPPHLLLTPPSPHSHPSGLDGNNKQ